MFARSFRRFMTTGRLAELDASKLKISRNPSPKALPPKDKLVFGKTMSNHMLTIEWDAETGWGVPEIKPYGPFQMDPAASVLHYAFTCFEGLKAFRDPNGQIRIFRPENNMARLNSSSARIALPTFDGDEAVKLIKELISVDKDMVPEGKGYALYIRPTMIGTQNSLGVAAPSKAMLYVITSPVGPYYPTGFKAIRLEATDTAVRAWPGGVGNKKLGANYAPCVLPQLEAAKRGLQQNLWLFDDYVTEVGTMNLFMVFKNPDGTKELVTPPLDGTILEGITRLSILELASQRLDPAEWTVSERKVKIQELAERAKKGELLEIFGAGTAAVVSPVREIVWHDESIVVPLPEGKEAGPVTETVMQWVQDIQYGVEDHPFSQPISKTAKSKSATA